MNPFGSVKDRAAAEMLRDLQARGLIGPDNPARGIVEPTSGNTGISLAGLCGARGIPMRAVVPNKVPLEKKILLKLFGAELDVVNDELCPSPGMGEGSINLAKTHAKASPDRYAMPNQYENRANVEAHRRTTGPEIWRQTRGRVTHLFVSLGTCGTVTGVGGYLKERNPAVRVIAVQPSEGHDVPGLRNVSQLDVSRLFDPSLIDEIIEIDFRLAYRRAIDLCRTEGLRAGPSSGLIFEGACLVARRALQTPAADQPGAAPASPLGVMIFCDDAFKYTSNFARHVPDLLQGTAPPSRDGTPAAPCSR